MTVRNCSHIFYLGKRVGLHYSDFSDRDPVFMRLGEPSYLKNCRFSRRVEKVGLEAPDNLLDFLHESVILIEE